MFSSREYLPDALIAQVTDTRVNDPECAWRAAQARKRRLLTAAPAGGKGAALFPIFP